MVLDVGVFDYERVVISFEKMSITFAQWRRLLLVVLCYILGNKIFYNFCISYAITICYKFLIKIVELNNLICVAICTTNSRNQKCPTCMAS